MAWNGIVKQNTYKYMHCGAIYNILEQCSLFLISSTLTTENWHKQWATTNAERFLQQTMPTTSDIHCIYCCTYKVDNNSIRWLLHSKCSVVMKFKPPHSIIFCSCCTSFIETFITARKLNEQVFRLCFAIILKWFEPKNIMLWFSMWICESNTKNKTLRPHVQCLSTRIFEFSILSSSCILRILSFWSCECLCLNVLFTVIQCTNDMRYETIGSPLSRCRYSTYMKMFMQSIHCVNSASQTKKRYRCWSEWRYVHPTQLFCHAIWNILNFKQNHKDRHRTEDTERESWSEREHLTAVQIYIEWSLAKIKCDINYPKINYGVCNVWWTIYNMMPLYAILLFQVVFNLASQICLFIIR